MKFLEGDRRISLSTNEEDSSRESHENMEEAYSSDKRGKNIFFSLKWRKN